MKIDTVKNNTAMSTGYNNVNDCKPVSARSSIMIFIKNESNNGHVVKMNKNTFKDDIIKKLKEDIKNLKDIKNKEKEIFKKNIIDMEIKNIMKCDICMYRPIIINNEYDYIQETIYSVKELLK